MEHKRQGEEKKEFLIKKMKSEIEIVKKENNYLRNRNFVINKEYQSDKLRMKKARILNKESE